MEGRLPELAIIRQPLRSFGERIGIQTAGTALRLALSDDEASAFKHLEVTRDGGLADGKAGGELAGVLVPVVE